MTEVETVNDGEIAGAGVPYSLHPLAVQALSGELAFFTTTLKQKSRSIQTEVLRKATSVLKMLEG